MNYQPAVISMVPVVYYNYQKSKETHFAINVFLNPRNPELSMKQPLNVPEIVHWDLNYLYKLNV